MIRICQVRITGEETETVMSCLVKTVKHLSVLSAEFSSHFQIHALTEKCDSETSEAELITCYGF